MKNIEEILISKIKSIEDFLESVGDYSWDSEYIMHNNKYILIDGYEWMTETGAMYDGKLKALKELLEEFKQGNLNGF